MLLALCIWKPVASQMVRDGETLSVAWCHHDHHESIDIHRCSQNGHVCLNSALHKLILHVHVRCWDFTIVSVSALGVTLEDMGKMHQSPNVKLVGIPGRHVLLTLKMPCVRLAYAPLSWWYRSDLCVFYCRQVPSYLLISFRINSMALWQS